MKIVPYIQHISNRMLGRISYYYTVLENQVSLDVEVYDTQQNQFSTSKKGNQKVFCEIIVN